MSVEMQMLPDSSDQMSGRHTNVYHVRIARTLAFNLYKANCFYLQIVIAEVLPPTTKMEWRVSLVNALMQRIALSYKLKVFCSCVPALSNKY